MATGQQPLILKNAFLHSIEVIPGELSVKNVSLSASPESPYRQRIAIRSSG